MFVYVRRRIEASKLTANETQTIVCPLTAQTKGVMAHMVCDGSSDGSTGIAVGIEHIPELASRSITDLQRASPALASYLERGCIEIHTGDGREG